MDARAGPSLTAQAQGNDSALPAVSSALRPIRSFVLRQGRFSPAQREAYETLLPKFGVAYSASPLDLERVFGRAHPKILEIGFGMGETTAAIAASMPDRDFLAIDVHAPGVGSLLRQIDHANLSNVRVMRHDAVEVVANSITREALAGVHVFFPDPWPKKRHHKRRLLKPAFVGALSARLAHGGYLHVATDWEEYATEILATLDAESSLVNTARGFAPRPDYRPLTKFERRGLARGHGVWDLVFRRR
ncbi:MAG: tRNA (guanosine(46)-N7)-methyltransferase TrmB [Betaproteobacteria bacterium]